MMIDYNYEPVFTEECYDDETKSMRWEILINGWSAGNSAGAASAIESCKSLVKDPGGRATLARLGFKNLCFVVRRKKSDSIVKHRSQRGVKNCRSGLGTKCLSHPPLAI